MKPKEWKYIENSVDSRPFPLSPTFHFYFKLSLDVNNKGTDIIIYRLLILDPMICTVSYKGNGHSKL